MHSAPRPMLRRFAPVLPTFALAVTATVGVIAVDPATPAATRVQTVSYKNGNPIGKLLTLTRTGHGLRTTGWAFDPSKSKRAIKVYARVSGTVAASQTAKRSQSGITKMWRAAGSKHGFKFFIPVPAGKRTICVYAKDIGRGKDTRLGCKRNATFYYGPNTAPPSQTTPAPVSTSRYVRNIRGACDVEAATMRNFGRYDAQHNPSGHRYMQLLDIGGQSQSRGGVVLSATTRFVTYANLVACSKAYIDGYYSGMLPKAPAVIAIGVNNDIDVNTTTGRDWATKVVNPLVAYAAGKTNLSVAGANDIEPGFSGTYSETVRWVNGYLAATKAPFVFNGSADGCSTSRTASKCNNGWTMSGLYNVAAGMAPTRMINLPQIYYTPMAAQWKYISLTGIGQGKPRINFGGPLTEVTACAQARSCDSMSGRSAWQLMWNNLQSHPKLRVGSLPYATDLRIDS